jgi:cell fate regulator YaaT (PSP1 superfamily)
MNTPEKIARGCPATAKVGSCAKLNVYDWLYDIKSVANTKNVVEIRFKNTRKDYYQNTECLDLKAGDMVAVEASPGHDIGMVSLVGDLVLRQLNRHKITLVDGQLRKVYRLAKVTDLEKWEEAIACEQATMLKARKIAEELKLNMKIGDVEYQGDKTKAIFYYIADDRVDFRQLIRDYADAFKIRIEMKQIGARQEAARIGGIAPCGRELCCSTWITNFVSVSTTAARYQEISLNPQKLAGQCGKLKCCLNFELDTYLDAQKNFPSTNIPLETEKGTYNYLKADIFKGVFWYVRADNQPGSLVAISVDKVKEIQLLNRSGKRVEQLVNEALPVSEVETHVYQSAVGDERIDRFDPEAKFHRKKRHSAVLTRKPILSNEDQGI